MSRVVLQILERYSTDKEYELHKSHDKQNSFHTLRYDFKPASVNSDEPASLELTSKGEVTIKAPNISGSSSSHTVFRGQRRPHVKECLLVIDNRTGEMVLQKLTDNITVKATRTLGNGASSSGGAPTVAGPNNGNGNGNGGGGSGSGNGASSNTKSTNSIGSNHTIGSTNNSSNHNNNNNTATTSDGPQLSEESSSSSDDDSSDSGSSSSSSSTDSDSSSQSNDEGFTF